MVGMCVLYGKRGVFCLLFWGDKGRREEKESWVELGWKVVSFLML